MHLTTRVFRRIALVACAALLAACAAEDLTKAPPPIGDFDLGYTIVVAENAKQAGPSRSASAEEWQAILQEEVVKRIGRYDGEKLYHLGLNIDAYALALPGVPLVFKPKSILSITANVWDDTAQRRINMEPKVILVFEKGSPKTYVGSGITQDREEQMHNLAAAAAREIGKWLVENKAWFSPEAVAIRAASPGRDLPPLASE